MEKLIISVSGIRGIYGTSLTQKHAFDFGKSFGFWAKNKNIIVGQDTRLSGSDLKSALVSGLLVAGKNVYDAGIVPTPALTWFVEKHNNFCGAIITASHNPVEYNGIKLISHSGTFLNPEEFSQLMKIYKGLRKRRERKHGIYYENFSIMEEYFSSLLNLIDVDAIKRKKFKVAVDPVQGVGSVFTKHFLEKLGCSVKMINDAPVGVFSRNPEPRPENLISLAECVRKESCDIGFAQDPDCDRLAVVADGGKIISEEKSTAIAIDWMLQKKKGPVVVNLVTTRLVDDIGKQNNVDVFRTKVGEVYVVEEMKRVNATAGGEGNGGIIYPDFHYGRDSFAGMAIILELSAKKEKSFSEIEKDFCNYYIVKHAIKYPSEKIDVLFRKAEKIFSDGKISYTDGIKIDFENRWVSIRRSGTESIVRIFAEAKTEKEATTLINRLLCGISSCKSF